MAASAIFERVKKLEERGFIRGYAAVISPEAVDLGLLAFLAVRTEDPVGGDTTARALAKRPEITDRLVKDVLERVDLVVQQLDRQLEAIRARHGNELRSLRDEVEALKASVAALASAAATEPEQPRPAAVE